MAGRKRDYRDIVGGGAMILAGAFAALYAMANLRLGTMTNMGPGMFPTALGVILAGLGGLVLVPALFREGGDLMPDIDTRSLAAVIAGMLTFMVMVLPFGIAPAILAMTLTASRADSKLSLLGATMLGSVLAFSAVLIFRIGLGLQVPIAAWPW